MNRVPWLILSGLVVVHHDFWFWNDSRLLGGWMPVGLAYHIALSIVAAGFWLFAVRCAWPQDEGDQSLPPDLSGAEDEGGTQ